jgi:nitrous oxidase accessory protein NosD
MELEATMRQRIRMLVIGGVLAGSLAGASSALAKTVCASGCPYKTVNSAIAALPPGSIISIEKGEYEENVVVNKELTLKGSGVGTVIRPAVSKPECEGGSLCGGEASNIVLVEANNVTIESMSLNGSNPKLAGEVERGGVKIDARNGIITNHLVGSFGKLTVSHVTVANVFLRGIYQSSENTFNFTRNKVENVQGSESSIAMFSFGSSGVYANNKVSKANDAISSNWSKGIQFTGNTINSSGSGIHTDNNGGFGGTADLIKGNKVSACMNNGYGIFVFAPYVSATVESNTIKGCSVGIAAFGSQAAGVGPKFIKNSVSGSAALSSEPPVGAYLTTDLLGFGHGDLNVTLEGNVFVHLGTGMLVTQTKPTPETEAGGQATVKASPNNSFMYDTTGAYGEEKTVVNAKEDYWGCSSGPNHPAPCMSALGTVEYEPFLVSKP